MTLTEEPVQHDTRSSTRVAVKMSTWRPTGLALGLCAILTTLVFAMHLYMSLYPFPLSGGNDALYHAEWIDEFVRIRSQGIWYPRWLNLGFGGYGAISMYFYPPLTYFLASAVNSITGVVDATMLYQSVQLIATVVSAVGLYLYLRVIGIERRAALLGAAFFAVAPMTMATVFLRNALAERVAYLWFPFLFLSVEYALQEARSYSIRAIVLSSLAIAGILLTNIPATIVMGITLPVYMLGRTGFRNLLRLWPLASGVAIALLLTGFYWLPILHFRPLMPIEHLFDFLDSRNKWGHVLVELSRSDVAKSGTHLVQAVTLLSTAAAAGFMWLLRKRQRPNDVFLRAWIAVAATIVFLQIPYVSDPVWRFFPPLQLLQFSFRLLSVASLFLGVAVAFCFSESQHLIAKWLFVVFAGLSCLWSIRYIYIVHTFPWPEPVLNAARICPPEHVPLTASSPDPRIIRSFARDHYGDPPAWFTDSTQPFHTIQLTSTTAIYRRYHIESATEDTVQFHLFYWPQWKLYRDSREIPTFAGKRGIASAVLPEGTYNLDLHLVTSKSETWGCRISAIGVTLFAMICALGVAQSRKRSN